MTYTTEAGWRGALPVAAALAAAAVMTLAQVPGDAYACSCVGGDAAQMAGNADAVFLGQVTSVTAESPKLQAELNAFTGGPSEAELYGQNHFGAVTTTFAVEQVFKGDLTAVAVVHSEANGAGCGFVYAPGLRYVVFANIAGSGDAPKFTDADIASLRKNPSEAQMLFSLLVRHPMGRLTTSLCSGNFVYAGADQARADLLGPGGTPVPAGTATAAGAQIATAAARDGWSVDAIATRLAAPPGEAAVTGEPIETAVLLSPEMTAEAPRPEITALPAPTDDASSATGAADRGGSGGTLALGGIAIAMAGALVAALWYRSRSARS